MHKAIEVSGKTLSVLRVRLKNKIYCQFDAGVGIIKALAYSIHKPSGVRLNQK
jgi:hypothetical protein